MAPCHHLQCFTDFYSASLPACQGQAGQAAKFSRRALEWGLVIHCVELTISEYLLRWIFSTENHVLSATLVAVPPPQLPTSFATGWAWYRWKFRRRHCINRLSTWWDLELYLSVCRITKSTISCRRSISSNTSLSILPHRTSAPNTMASTSGDGDGDGAVITIQVTRSGKTLTAVLPKNSLLSDLITSCEESDVWAAASDSHFDWDKAKFIAKGQMLRAGADDDKPIPHLEGKKVTLQVPTVEDIQGLQQSSDAAKARQAMRQAQRRAAVPARQTRRQGDSEHTFLRIEPLLGLRNPERSREFLVRLAEDPGIKAAMKKHQFTGTCKTINSDLESLGFVTVDTI